MGIAQEGNGLPCNRRVDEANFCAVCNKVVKAGMGSEGHGSEFAGVLTSASSTEPLRRHLVSIFAADSKMHLVWQ